MSSTNFELDSFKNPDFNVDSWINKVISNFQDTDQKVAISTISNKLDEEILKINEELEKLTGQIIKNIPKAQRDFEVVQREVKNLQDEMFSGLNEAENVQKKTTSSMSNLEAIDNMKTKLVSISMTLQEADRWTSLAKQIEQLLDSGNVNKSYECILGMEKSLSVLNEAQAEERRLILEEMKNRLEALATKHLILAFDTNNTDNSKYFYTMFANLERSQQFIKYFQNSEKIKLSQEWRKIVEILSFKDASVKFYDNLIDHWHSKIQWCKIIFSEDSSVNSCDVLLDLYAEALKMMEPSLQFCFETETKKVPFIDLLFHFNQSTHRYIQNLKQAIDSQVIKPDKEKLKSLLKTLFIPFLTQYSKYAKYHETVIVGKIHSAFTPAEGDMKPLLQEKLEILKMLLPEIVLTIKEGEEKLLLFNQGFGYIYFGKGLSSGLERFVNANKDIYKYLEKSIQNSDKHRNLIENILSFTEFCGDILLQITKLDQDLTTNSNLIFSKIGSPINDDSDPWSSLWNYYLDENLMTEIQQFTNNKEKLLGNVLSVVKKLCKEATQLTLRVTSEPIESQLKKNFSLSGSTLKDIPSEYITQIGEYLMLLPQNIEPYIVIGKSSISFAFDQSTEDEVQPPVDFILSNVASSICEAYTDCILKSTFMSEGQAKQLAQDIEYLNSVMDDLGLKLTSDLFDLSKLIKNFQSINEATLAFEKVSPRLLFAVKKMKVKPVP